MLRIEAGITSRRRCCSRGAYILGDRDRLQTSKPRYGWDPEKFFRKNSPQAGERITRWRLCWQGGQGSLRWEEGIWPETCRTRSWAGEGWAENIPSRENCMRPEFQLKLGMSVFKFHSGSKPYPALPLLPPCVPCHWVRPHLVQLADLSTLPSL